MARPRIEYEVGVDDRTRRSLGRIEQRFQRIAKVGAVALAGAATAGTAALTGLTAKALKSADALGKVSDKLGEVPSRIQGLQRAAELTGVSVDTANMALQRMVRRTSEAAAGTGEARGALAELNLDARELARLSPADQFQKIAGAMEGVSNQGDRVRLSMKLFDSEGVALVNTLALGEQGLKDIQQEISDYGLALTRIDIAQIEAANDAFFRARETTKAFGQQFAVQVAPVLEAITNRFLDAAKEAGGMGNVAQKAFQAITTGAGFVADAVNGLRLAFLGVKTIALSALAAPLVALAELEKGTLNFINTITGSDLEGAIGGISDRLVAEAIEAQEAFSAALLQPPPSETIRAFIDPIIAESQAAAREAAEAGLQIGGLLSENSEARIKEEERVAKATKKWNDYTAKVRFANAKQGIAALQNLVGGSKTAARALALLQSALSVAEIIMNTEVAAMRALAELGPIAGPPVAAAIRTQGAISAGIAGAAGVLQAAGVGSGGGGGSIAVPAESAFSTNTTDLQALNVQPANNITVVFDKEGITDTNALRDFIENDFAEALNDVGGLNVQVVAR